MNHSKEYKLDARTASDIEEKIEELAASYVPEWKFDRENADIGSVIGILYARQMEDNLRRFNLSLQRYRDAFADMLGISLLPARPACTVLSMSLIRNTMAGVYVERGTRFLGSAEEQGIVFETSQPLFVTGAELKYVYMVSGADGKVCPVKGGFISPLLIPEEADGSTEPADEMDTEGTNVRPFSLFRFQEPGIGRNAMVFYDSRLFDIENETIFMKIEGNGNFLSRILKGEFSLLYFSDQGFRPVEELRLTGDCLTFQKSRPCRKVLPKKRCSVLALVSNQPVMENISFSGISFSSSGRWQAPLFAGNGVTEYETEDFAPFGDTIFLYAECYIGHDPYFSKAGAGVTVRFELSFREHVIRLSENAEEDELKIIKRKPRTILAGTADTCAAEISLEYYNGRGWKRLVCEGDSRSLFSGPHRCRAELCFTCPEDWQGSQVSGYQGRMIRIQVLKADNCYMVPCVHHYPVVKNMEISYSYENRFMTAEKTECICGTGRKDITGFLTEGKIFDGFVRSRYYETALYMGFDRKPEGGPVSILFELEDTGMSEGIELHYFYSSAEGFRPLRVTDRTGNMTGSGTVRFLPPEDMACVELEGKKACWLRIVRDDKTSAKRGGEYYPLIRDIVMNAVEAYNIETMPEEDYYLEEIKPDMVFPLNAVHILDADVWVNEKRRMNETQMKERLREQPDETRAEYDCMGEIREFYVKWTEVDTFDFSDPSDRHYRIDRLNNRILFGDGIHVNIPREMQDTAFTVRVRSCSGEKGNVEAGAISEPAAGIVSIGRVTNRVPAFGGSGMETVEHALCRCANQVSAGKRLVAAIDYIREVCSVSEMIDKVSCVTGRTVNGRIMAGMVSIVILMKDFGSGTHSFEQVLPEIRKTLGKCREMTLAESRLQITEPIEVKISVDVWAGMPDGKDDYEIRQRVKEELEQYFSPVSSGGLPGWDIGVLPRHSQIMMKLNSMKSGLAIHRLVITGTYTDASGVCQQELESIRDNPFFICTSGEHKVHIIAEGMNRRGAGI